MEAILVEGVRCFRESQEIPLRKLTLLVGENSTGKSTLLALARLSWDLLASSPVDFNKEPFLLGSFEQIATSSQANSGAGFQMGMRVRWKDDLLSGNPQASIVGAFKKSGPQPSISQLDLESGSYHLSLKLDENRLTVKSPSRSVSASTDTSPQPHSSDRLAASLEIGFKNLLDQLSKDDSFRLENLVYEVRSRLKKPPHAFAPIRTHPQRTYDPLTEGVEPTGSHVPMILSRIAAREPETWESLRQAIQDFGRVSGLFDEVEVRHLGEQDSDPFQLRVKIAGATVNLIDVGYGVSQALPILVDCIRADPHTTFLLQQPEVHLHPRAQAELGTFLSTLSRAQSKQFLVETHSDYLIDRVRMDVRDGKALAAEDVLILYFEREPSGDVTVHPIEIDGDGNLLNVPPGYRDFFLAEERRFLEGVSG